jgi:predicted small secreted protein
MKNLIKIVLIAALGLQLTACNTVRGIGQDVQKAGQVIEGAGKK